MKCRRSIRHQPKDRCKSLLSSRWDTCELFHAMEVQDEGQDRLERVISVNVQGINCTRAVIVRPTRRRGGQRTTEAQASPIRLSRRLRPPARGARTMRAVTRRSGPGNVRCTSRHMSSSGRRRLNSFFFRGRRTIGSLPTTRSATGEGVRSLCRLLLARPVPPLDD